MFLAGGIVCRCVCKTPRDVLLVQRNKDITGGDKGLGHTVFEVSNLNVLVQILDGLDHVLEIPVTADKNGNIIRSAYRAHKHVGGNLYINPFFYQDTGCVVTFRALSGPSGQPSISDFKVGDEAEAVEKFLLSFGMIGIVFLGHGTVVVIGSYQFPVADKFIDKPFEGEPLSQLWTVFS